MSSPDFEEEWVECHDCGGSGRDEQGGDWAGRCDHCGGKGERLTRDYACEHCSAFGCGGECAEPADPEEVALATGSA